MRFKDYISLNQIKVFKENPFNFVSQYILGKSPPAKKTLIDGNKHHELFYDFFIRNKIKGYVTKPEDLKLTTKDGKAWKQQQIDLNKTILKEEELEMALQWCLQAEVNPFLKNILAYQPILEKELLVPFDLDGIEEPVVVKGFLDILYFDKNQTPSIIDIKTSSKDVNKENFIRYLEKDYSYQQIIYTALLKKAMELNMIDHPFLNKEKPIERTTTFSFLLLENKFPYNCILKTMPINFLESCNNLFTRDLYKLVKFKNDLKELLEHFEPQDYKGILFKIAEKYPAYVNATTSGFEISDYVLNQTNNDSNLEDLSQI